jgi:peptidoglycan/xylan/chitin deacetylase (PgdA/CDA1 family)
MAHNTVINLCFHGIGTPRRELEPGEAPYWVTVDLFHAVLDEASGWPNVQLSFDDGNASDVDIALPALAERGLSADFFVLAGRLGSPGSLDEDAVRRLRRAGMRVGTHGWAHRSWRNMDGTTRADELVVARQRLAAVAGTAVDRAACPLGQYDRKLLTHLRTLGYDRVFTSDRRPAQSHAWLQPRYSVRRHDTRESLHTEIFRSHGLLRRARSRAVAVAKQLR